MEINEDRIGENNREFGKQEQHSLEKEVVEMCAGYSGPQGKL